MTERGLINDCWNKIGVWGDRSCPELEKHIHCRNCPTYTAAAVERLDGELPAGYLEDWTVHLAREQAVKEVHTESAVVFRIGAEWLALPTSVFKEVSALKTIHSLPHRRDRIVLGLVNIRGELLVCVSLGEALAVEPAPEMKSGKRRAIHGRMLVASREGARLVFPVDEVHGIHRFHSSEVQNAPATQARALATYTRGLIACGTMMAGWIDDQLMFYTLNKSLS